MNDEWNICLCHISSLEDYLIFPLNIDSIIFYDEDLPSLTQLSHNEVISIFHSILSNQSLIVTSLNYVRSNKKSYY